MGGEGSMAAANASLKNNRSLTAKRKDKKALEGSYAGVELKEFPKVTEEQIVEIRERIKKENKQARIKQVLIFVAMCIVLLFFIKYLL
ncbi:hypothetical protein A8C32_14585 [Flavivirga aquatica]|uniref:Uncharacterized protein n=1 Tax=Flavivirga aquatica TaxID=1849968 RepID=A0A1E5TCN8_9FLAO|nr:hypothetical protein [Flavivirga aquatica]OEK09107.1 hypothetical protein A8C32_14585 [Flavivirga aquatica]